MTEDNKLKDYLFKEVEIIQNIIDRMARNSFLIKGWSITLILVALLLRGTQFQVFLAFIPLFVFWYLDAYFLWQERLYRKLYLWVIENRVRTDEFLFDMNAYRFKDEVQSKIRIMFSVTLGWFYGSIGVFIAIYIIFLFIIKKEGC